MVPRARESERDPPPYATSRSGDNRNRTSIFDIDYSAIMG
jgi:hypothetical protein